MSSSLKLRTAGGIVAVLVIAAFAYVLRGTLAGDPTALPSLPPGAAVAHAGPERFSLRAAGRNVIPEDASTIATARHRSLRVYPRPTSKRAQRSRGKRMRGKRFRQRVFHRQRIPLTFLVRYRRKGWVKVELPTRPNHSRGWVRRKDVDLSFTRLWIEVRTRAHRLRLLEGRRVVLSVPNAVGRALSPTPPGRYFVTDVIRAKNPKGFYGPYALGLSAHSTVYTSFEGGNGQVGIHGTNQPAAIGSDVSHGCIRVRNSVIRRLAKRVPLGTPVVIRR